MVVKVRPVWEILSRDLLIRQRFNFVGKDSFYGPVLDAREPLKELFHRRAILEILE